MGLYLIVLAVFVLAFAGMALGVILSNRCIKGSCGGLSNLRDEQGNSLCESCTTPKENCAASSLRRTAEQQHDESRA